MLRRLLLSLIAVYQKLLSPLTGNCCRFEPSCSRYASLCLQHHGALEGIRLTLGRLLRCNPFFSGGIDLPPGVDPKLAEPDWERLTHIMDSIGQPGSEHRCAPTAPSAER